MGGDTDLGTRWLLHQMAQKSNKVIDHPHDVEDLLTMQKPVKITAVVEIAGRRGEASHDGCRGVVVCSFNSTDPMDDLGVISRRRQGIQTQRCVDQLDQLLTRCFRKIE